MLTREDCLALCDLSEEEINAIVEHEHIPELCAIELGHYLVETSDGQLRLRRFILDDIRAAEGRGDRRHAARLKLVLHHFGRNHPRRPGSAGHGRHDGG